MYCRERPGGHFLCLAGWFGRVLLPGQFLRLRNSVAAIDRRRYYIDNVGGLLTVFQAIVAEAVPK